MRGAYKLEHDLRRWIGITPAHAGSIASNCPGLFLDQDHPRACGEHRVSTAGRYPLPGSPPRMRGALKLKNNCNKSTRITPAHAGSMYPSKPGYPGPEDHPRACGEHFASQGRSCRSAGSPPRMRGA